MKQVVTAMFVLLAQALQAQKKMQVPAPLDTVTPVHVTWKTGIGLNRFHMEPYKLVNARQRWVSTRRETEGGNLAGFLSNVRGFNQVVKERQSFQVVSAAGDTAVVNMAVSTVLQFDEFKRGLLGNRYEGSRYNGGYITWVAAVETGDTSQNWILTAYQEERQRIGFTKASPLEAVLRNGEEELQLQQVRYYETGKKAWNVIGFVLLQNGEPLGAVQFNGDNPLKYNVQSFIWIGAAVPPERQLLIYTTLATVMVIGHDSVMNSPQQKAGPMQ